jgi:hypothetical protein
MSILVRRLEGCMNGEETAIQNWEDSEGADTSMSTQELAINVWEDDGGAIIYSIGTC